jgi:hypothetical protein
MDMSGLQEGPLGIWIFPDLLLIELHLEYLYLIFQGQVHPQPLRSFHPVHCRSANHKIVEQRQERLLQESDMVQPSLKCVCGERKCWKCFKTDCIGAKNKSNCPNACACHRKDCHGKNSWHPTHHLGRNDVD